MDNRLSLGCFIRRIWGLVLLEMKRGIEGSVATFVSVFGFYHSGTSYRHLFSPEWQDNPTECSRSAVAPNVKAKASQALAAEVYM